MLPQGLLGSMQYSLLGGSETTIGESGPLLPRKARPIRSEILRVERSYSLLVIRFVLLIGRSSLRGLSQVAFRNVDGNNVE
jgi:hypothetical protein